MPISTIFSDNFLSHYTSDFKLSNVTDIRGITLIIKELVKELESGKIESLKEEEIKARFVDSFFGDILGFNYGNSNKWQLREEKKSTIDGTRPDAALGYFYIDNKKDDVRAVVEIKDAKTILDEKQSRVSKQSPVDQAFEYAAKAGGNCKWVIVSNIKEIRFYPSLDRAKCQVYLLKDLVNENKLRELLFLFHKDRFIKEYEKSSTDKLFDLVKTIQPQNDKPIHIIDRIYNCLKRFDGLGFVDPNYITTIFPFNILDEHVWQYNSRNLFTINAEIYELLKGINIENENIAFSEELKTEIINSNIVEAEYKIEWSFTFLNRCLIDEITAIKDYKLVEARNKNTIGFSHRHSFHFNEGVDGITKNIRIIKDEECDSLICNFQNLEFNKLLGKLRAAAGDENFNTFEYAYGNYLTSTNNFKTTFNIYKSIEKELKGKEGKGVEYFLLKMNIKHLHFIDSYYYLEDVKVIMNDIKSVDLDKVIYDEIEFDVDRDVKKYLIDVKEDVLIYKIQDEIEEIVFNIEKLKLLYDNGGKQYSGPNLPANLQHQYYLLYLHINANCIIYDTFSRYKSLAEKVFNGLVISYHIPERGINAFHEFFLTEAILHIQPSSLQEILKKEDNLKVIDDGIERLLEKLNNFLSSIYKDGFFSDAYENELISEQLHNYNFRDRFTNIFANLFTVFSRLTLSKEQFSKSRNLLLKFLKVENVLAWYDLKELSNFILQKGDLFEPKSLLEILTIAINGDRYGYNKYSHLIEEIPNSIVKFYPEYKIDNIKLIQTALLNCSSDDGKNANCMHLVNLSNICNQKCKQLLYTAFEEQLDEDFSLEFYELLIRNSDYGCNQKNYFQLYSEKINSKKSWAYKFGKQQLTNRYFINFIFIIYELKVDFNRSELKSFTDLNEFETWIINPFEFNYEKFDPIWLTELNYPVILDKIKSIKQINSAIDIQLKENYNPTLAEIKYKYFNI